MPVSLLRVAPRTPAVPAPEPAGTAGVPGAASGFIAYHPRYEQFLRRCGIGSPEAALGLRGEVVGGHPDRHVARVELGAGAARRVVYLKREHVVGVRTRVRNLLAKAGWVSRAEREADALRRLEEAGLPGPQWLAYGEDGRGRAFLLVDDLTGAADLRAVLGAPGLSADDRRALAELAGRTVADLHDAGFGTPDLAAKHLLVHPGSLAVTPIDWQSAPPPGPVADADRVRQLAGLHASLAADLAPARDRLRFLWAYLRMVRHHRKPTGDPAPRFGAVARAVAAAAGRRAGRSSARDQRAAAGRPGPRLVWLAGEAVCAVPEVADLWPAPAECPPFYPGPGGTPGPEEWVTFPGGRRALLVRWATVAPLGRLVAAARERPWRSPAANAARVLFHLRRYGVPAPALLAFGQRLRSPTRADSFVLFEPGRQAVPVAARLAAAPPAARRALLADSGAVLRRLHDAGCRPAFGPRPVLVTAPDRPAVGVDSPFAVRLVKRVGAAARRGDLRALLRRELPGLSRADRCRVARGYLGHGRPADRSLLTRVGCR